MRVIQVNAFVVVVLSRGAISQDRFLSCSFPTCGVLQPTVQWKLCSKLCAFAKFTLLKKSASSSLNCL